MRKKKAEKLKEEQFWINFFYFNLPANVNEVPAHLERANFRYYHVDDEELGWMMEYVKSIYQLDMDETGITNAGIALLAKMDHVTELRLKNCEAIDAACLNDLLQIKELELLHLGGTAITAVDLNHHPEKFSRLKTLLISMDDMDVPALEELYTSLPAGCELLVNHKAFPFTSD